MPDTPRRDRPQIPAEYGVGGAKAFVDWSHVEDRLTSERVYWVATVHPDDRPHVRPIDGLYLDGVIYVGGSPEARWVRFLNANPNVSVQLGGADDVIVFEGEAEVLKEVPRALAKRLAAASNLKFPEYGMTPDAYGPGVIAIRPSKVIAWTNFTKDPTRFQFGD